MKARVRFTHRATYKIIHKFKLAILTKLFAYHFVNDKIGNLYCGYKIAPDYHKALSNTPRKFDR